MKKFIFLLILFCIVLSGCQANTLTNDPASAILSPSPSPEPLLLISLETQPYDLTGMRMAWCTELDLRNDGTPQLISLYVRADRMEDGSFAFDDGQDWALLVETDTGIYPLFPRAYVQLGMVSCSVFRSMESDDALHVLVTCSQGAGLEVYDYVYDPLKDAFIRNPVYTASNISSLGGSLELRSWFWNYKLADFSSFVDTLPRKDKTEAAQAFEALQPMMAMGEILPNEAVDIFIDFMEGLASNMEYAEYDAAAMILLQSDYAPYFIRFYESGGFLYPIPDIAAMADTLEGKVDWDYSQYFDLVQWQKAEGLEHQQVVRDAALMVSWNRFADLLVQYENFVHNHSEFARSRGLHKPLEHYIHWYLSPSRALDNSPITANNALLPEVRDSYAYFIETFAESRLGDVVSQIYAIWQKENWQYSEAVKEQIESLLTTILE